MYSNVLCLDAKNAREQSKNRLPHSDADQRAKQTAKQKPRFTFSTVNCGLNVFALWSAPYATANEYSSVIRQRV